MREVSEDDWHAIKECGIGREFGGGGEPRISRRSSN
jgi:hypothetical protein